MSLGNRGNHSGLPATGGGGYAMPHIKHPLVTELHYDGSTGLTFETWHKDPNTDKWHDIDDTDVLPEVKHTQIPEPASLLLLALGLYGIIATKKVRIKVLSKV